MFRPLAQNYATQNTPNVDIEAARLKVCNAEGRNFQYKVKTIMIIFVLLLSFILDFQWYATYATFGIWKVTHPSGL